MSAEAFPLQWPDGWPRTKFRGRPRYNFTYERALSHLTGELRRMGARHVVVSSNVPVRRDGLPYAEAARRKQEDPGVAVYFTRVGQDDSQTARSKCHEVREAAGVFQGNLTARRAILELLPPEETKP